VPGGMPRRRRLFRVLDSDILLDENGYVAVYKIFGHSESKFDENKHYLYPVPIE
jgi:hypothetical protein